MYDLVVISGNFSEHLQHLGLFLKIFVKSNFMYSIFPAVPNYHGVAQISKLFSPVHTIFLKIHGTFREIVEEISQVGVEKAFLKIKVLFYL